MWIIAAPSSTTRLASAAYSSGVYGMAAHWSRLAMAPLMELVMTTGFSKRLIVVLQGCGSRGWAVAGGRGWAERRGQFVICRPPPADSYATAICHLRTPAICHLLFRESDRHH